MLTNAFLVRESEFANLMLRLLSIAIAIFCVSLGNSYAERQIVEIAQPISLLGTEGEDEPLKDGQWMSATILRRPTVIGGAFPESPVLAMCLPHRVAGAPEGFPAESNLIVLVGAIISAEWGKDAHTIRADFSNAKVDATLGVTLLQVMQLTAECLRQNLQRKDDMTPIRIEWKVPDGMKIENNRLPKEIK